MILLNSVKDLFGVIVRMVIDQNDFLNDVVALNNATLQGSLKSSGCIENRDEDGDLHGVLMLPWPISQTLLLRK